MGLCVSLSEGINSEKVDKTHFKILSTVGKGGFGKVKVAQDRKMIHKIKITGRKRSIYTRETPYFAMKFQDLKSLIQKTQLWQNAWTERSLMSKVKSPFVVELKYAFLDNLDLVFVMPFLRGGDLGYYLQRGGAMSEREARFYAAEMLLGIEAIHKLNYVYRDLKLENVLLDAEGHIRITDLGHAIELSERDKENKNVLFAERYPPPHHMRTRGCAGTPGYIAPELINMKSYGFMPDFFTFGATLARLISKTTPFSTKLMDKNSVKRENFPTPWLPKNVSSECRDLIRRLCAFEEAKRLGFENFWEEVKEHPWFSQNDEGFDWEEVKSKSAKPPIMPNLEELNFNPLYAAEEQIMGKSRKPLKSEDRDKVQEVFKGIEYNTSRPFQYE